MKRVAIVGFIGIALGFLGCGAFDDAPENFEGTLTAESNLGSDYDEAAGTVELHFMDDEIHVNLSGLPEAEEGCMYVAYASTADETISLGMVTLEEAVEASESAEEEGEHGHLVASMEMEEEADHHHEEGAGHEGEEAESAEMDESAEADESEEHHHHYTGELEATGSSVGVNLHDITAVTCYLECSGSATKIFSADLTSGSSSGGEESTGGHTH